MKRAVVLLFAVALLAACGGQLPANPARIAFVSNRDGNPGIYAINTDGSGLTRLSGDLAQDHHPACSPDGNRIAFESGRDGNVEIYLMNADGSGLTRLTRDPAPDFEPTWSPDGCRIAFTSFRSGNGDSVGEIYLINADGSGPTRLTNNPAADAWPAWSPDGRRLAFVSDRDGKFEIYLMNTDGSNLTRLTDNPTGNGSPAWSPDGRHIAFVSSRDGSGQVYVMRADGSAQTNLTHNPETSNCCPAWSPDGTRIAFLSRRYEYQPGGDSRGKSALYVMDPDGSDQTRLTDHEVWERRLVWSPDSRRIAFESYRDGNLEIYVINADGSNLTRLTNNLADDGWPAGCGSSAPASPSTISPPALASIPPWSPGGSSAAPSPIPIFAAASPGSTMPSYGLMRSPTCASIEKPRPHPPVLPIRRSPLPPPTLPAPRGVGGTGSLAGTQEEFMAYPRKWGRVSRRSSKTGVRSSPSLSSVACITTISGEQALDPRSPALPEGLEADSFLPQLLSNTIASNEIAFSKSSW